ncbi:thioesterase II family protein [Streptomyces sp. NPDC059104]|uniref:thioesterase II family protein n=1 Tax=Streptomyces sp. NPDC059104 TaxID=3346729 RepID=UPI003675D845
MTSETDWFIPQLKSDQPSLRVFTLPQAGGGCATFASAARSMGPGIDVWGLNLPGRQARFAEPARSDLYPLVEEIADAFPRFVEGPYAFVGYCSGSLLALLLTKALKERGRQLPEGLVTISFRAPHRPSGFEQVHTLESEDFWREILSYGGVPEALVSRPEYRELFEPSLRADHALVAAYRDAPVEPLDVPISVLGGRRDPVLGAAELLEWQRYTAAGFALRLLDGAHWLLEEPAARLPEAIGRELRGFLADGASGRGREA